MKLKDAIKIILSESHTTGYMISFEQKDGSVLRSDHFPDKNAGEELIEDLDTAWKLAELFAEKTRGKTVNVYVIDDKFRPVAGYEKRKMNHLLD